MFIDLNNRKTAMLLMIGAKATIIRTACINAGLEMVGTIPGLYPVKASAVVVRIGRDQCLANPVGSTPLLIKDILALNNNLGRHRRETFVTQRCCLTMEKIVR